MSSGTLGSGKRRLCDAEGGCALLQVHGEEGALHLPDVAHLGPVLQEPAVGHLVLPAHVPGVLPQQPDLVAGVPGMPQGVAEMLPRTRLRLNGLDDTSEVLEQNTQTALPAPSIPGVVTGWEFTVTIWWLWIWTQSINT